MSISKVLAGLAVLCAVSLGVPNEANACGEACLTIRQLKKVVGYGCVGGFNNDQACTATTSGCTFRACVITSVRLRSGVVLAVAPRCKLPAKLQVVLAAARPSRVHAA